MIVRNSDRDKRLPNFPAVLLEGEGEREGEREKDAKRQRGKKESWRHEIVLLSGNFFPVITGIYCLI